MPEINQMQLDNIGLVIYYGRELESELRALGGTGIGAGELVNSIRDRIPDALFRDICYMMGMRNRFAHSSDGGEAPGIPENFVPAEYSAHAESVLRRLREMRAAREAAPVSVKSSRSDEATPELDELRRMRGEFRRRCRVLCCIPLINWFYFLTLSFGAFNRAAMPLAALLLGILAVPPAISGFTDMDKVHLACAAALLVASYALSLTVFKGLTCRIRWWWRLPFLNLIKLCGVVLSVINWKKLLCGLAGLGFDIWAVWALFASGRPWRYFLTGMIAAYALGLWYLIFAAPAEREEDEA